MYYSRLLLDYSIVLVGNFNPLEYDIKWLKEKEFIDSKTVNSFFVRNEKKYLFSSSVTSFIIDDVQITIENNRIAFKNLKEDEETNIFKKIIYKFCSALFEKTIDSFGFNYNVEYLYEDSEYEKIIKQVGCLSFFDKNSKKGKNYNYGKKYGFNFSFTKFKDNGEGSYNINIDTRINKNTGKYGFWVNCNNHFQLDKSNTHACQCDVIGNMISSIFDEEFKKTKEIHDLFIGE